MQTLNRRLSITTGILAVIIIVSGLFSACGHEPTTPTWQITESNSWMRDAVTVDDFVPLGVTYIETEDHRLIYTDDPRWRLSCFILGATGITADGQHEFMYQGRLPFEGEGLANPRIFLDGRWYTLPHFSAPMYYDGEKRIYPYPTVYVWDASGGYEYIETMSYNEREREWIHTVEPFQGQEGIALEIHAKARSVPFWMGRQEGPYIVHGTYLNREDVDIWGGFWDMGEMEANLSVPDVGSYTFYGFFLWDRATHRAYYTEPAPRGGYAVAFSCFCIHQDDLDIMITRSINPSPATFPQFQHQGRINFPTRGKDFTFDNFEFSDNGGLQPSEYYLSGEYQAGEVNLTGKVFEFWPRFWGGNPGTWWDSDALCAWGRAFINWSGTITLNGETIEVDALGFGEFTRVETE